MKREISISWKVNCQLNHEQRISTCLVEISSFLLLTCSVWNPTCALYTEYRNSVLTALLAAVQFRAPINWNEFPLQLVMVIFLCINQLSRLGRPWSIFYVLPVKKWWKLWQTIATQIDVRCNCEIRDWTYGNWRIPLLMYLGYVCMFLFYMDMSFQLAESSIIWRHDPDGACDET
jgi:hypothetical protein